MYYTHVIKHSHCKSTQDKAVTEEGMNSYIKPLKNNKNKQKVNKNISTYGKPLF